MEMGDFKGPRYIREMSVCEASCPIRNTQISLRHSLVIERVAFIGNAEEDDLAKLETNDRVQDSREVRPSDHRISQQAAPPEAGIGRIGRVVEALAVLYEETEDLIGIAVVHAQEAIVAHFDQVHRFRGRVETLAHVRAD